MTHERRSTILHILHSLEGGGTERVLLTLLQGLDPSRRRHAVVTLRKAGSLAARLPDHVACRALNAQNRSRMAGLSVGAVARKRNVALIHARNTGCWADAMVARFCAPRSRLVLSFHGLERGQPLDAKQRCLLRLATRIGAWFSTVSESGQQQLIVQGNVPGTRIHVLPNGVDTKRFRPGDHPGRGTLRDALGVPRNAVVIGTVGSLTVVKDHSTLVSAFAQVAFQFPDSHLLIVGDGPLREAIMQKVREDGLSHRVTLAGQREDVPELLGAMDVYVCSSVSESMSNALLEAMACGLPVVTTHVGDHARRVGGDVGPGRCGSAGIVVPAGNASTLADGVAAVLRNRGAAHAYATAARARATCFDEAAMLRRYEAFYDAMLS